MPNIPAATSWSGSVISTQQELVAKVCALKGFSTADPSLVTQVLGFLDDVIKDLNTYPWESTKVSETYNLTQDQQYITLDELFFKESLVYLTHTTIGDMWPLKGLPYIQFKRLYTGTSPDHTTSGRPQVYTIFNFEKNGRLQFDISPDSDTATNYDLVVEYYKRLPLISSVKGQSSAAIPDYFENTIVYGAFKRMAAHLGDDNGVKLYSSLEREALERLQRIDTMHPDADRRFRLMGESTIYGWYANGYIYPF